LGKRKVGADPNGEDGDAQEDAEERFWKVCPVRAGRETARMAATEMKKTKPSGKGNVSPDSASREP